VSIYLVYSEYGLNGVKLLFITPFIISFDEHKLQNFM